MLPDIGISDYPHLLNFCSYSLLEILSQTASTAFHSIPSLPSCTLYFPSYSPTLEFIFYPFFLRKLLLSPTTAHNQMTTVLRKCCHRFRA